MNECKVADLSPLAGSRIRHLEISNTDVTDLKPIRNLPLEELNVDKTPIADLTPLREMRQLKTLSCSIRNAEELKLIRSLDSLRVVNGRPFRDVRLRIDGRNFERP